MTVAGRIVFGVSKLKQSTALRSLEKWVNVTSDYGVTSQKTRVLMACKILTSD